MRMPKLLASLLTLPLLAACAHSTASGTAAAKADPARNEALVQAPDRTAEDRELDAGRRPAGFLTALGVTPGMSVGELFAGGGYTTELLARAVGPSGHVYAENSKWVLEKFAEKPWQERLARPVNQNVTREDRELDAPFPPELDGKLDEVVTNANYHDAVWMEVDRSKMNHAVLAALKPGGIFVVCDSSTVAGAGLTQVKTLHRIDEASVKSEVEAAGFKLLDSSDVMRHPDDTRDWSASPGAAGAKRGSNDRFLLRFQKPTA